MTYTTQPLVWNTTQKTKNNRKLTEDEENICDILAVCESMNRLCEALNRLDLVLQRKNIEAALAGNG